MRKIATTHHRKAGKKHPRGKPHTETPETKRRKPAPRSIPAKPKRKQRHNRASKWVAEYRAQHGVSLKTAWAHYHKEGRRTLGLNKPESKSKAKKTAHHRRRTHSPRYAPSMTFG